MSPNHWSTDWITRRNFLIHVPASALALTELTAAITGETPSLVWTLLWGVPQSEIQEQAWVAEIHTENNDTTHEGGISKIDLAGTALFAMGIKKLLEGKHIDETLYAWLVGLLYAKYSTSDGITQHHLVEEIQGSLKALGIIAGTVAVTEWFQMDIQKAFIEAKWDAPETRDAVALLTMFSSVISPVATTVGNANIVKTMAQEIADGDKDIMAHFVGHNSGRSGYLLFWDPPFVAVVDKYGFKEWVLWQLSHMWPLALYSLFSTTFKVNLKLHQNKNSQNVVQNAVKDTIWGMLENVWFLSQVIAQSLGNFGKYHSIGKQDIRGIQFSIGEALTGMLKNIARLPWDKRLSHDHHEALEGMVSWESGETLRKLAHSLADSIIEKDETDAVDEHARRSIEEAFVNMDLKWLQTFLQEKWISLSPDLEAYLKESFQKLDGVQDEEVQETKRGIFGRVFGTLGIPVKWYYNISNLDRIKAAVGHNMADVLNVFPFQAGCVPFLLPLFDAGLKKLDDLGVSPAMKEQALFFALMGFSMVADNYVACKIGLELLPEKPHISLIAAIEWGELSAIGNMANVTQFNLETYSLSDSLQRTQLSADNIAVAWSYAFLILWGIFPGGIPEPLEKLNQQVQH